MLKSKICFFGFLLGIGTALVYADPVVQMPSVIFQGNGIYTYAYQISDSNSATDSVFALTLFGVSGILEGSDFAPKGWFASVDNNTQTVSWTSQDPSFDIQPGLILGGFRFQSINAPANAVFIGYGSDPVLGFPTGNFDSGQTQGPSSVPEPSTPSLLTGVLIAII